MNTDIGNFYGNPSHMEANPDLYWRLDEISNYTPEMMKELMKKELGVDECLPGGRFVLLKHFQKPKGLIELPKAIEEDNTKFSTKTGLVLAFGPEAYREKKEYPAGARCKIGHHAQFRRYQNEPVTINGITCSLVYDMYVCSPISDPIAYDTGW